MAGTGKRRPGSRGPGALAKISRPRVTDVLARERLFERLDRERARPVVWVTGPPGSGKTTLVASYLQARRLSGIWYQVDEGDEDLAGFFYYLGLAGKRASPLKRSALPLLTPEHLPDLPRFVRRFFRNLFARLNCPAALVLDNYQVAAADAPFQEMVAVALGEVPDGFNIIVLSRQPPPPALSRLQANGDIGLIGWEALQLRAREAAAIVRLRTQGRLPSETVRRWVAKTRGWVAGLVLLAEWTKTGAVEPEAVAQFSPETMFAYFTREILLGLDRSLRKFLYKSALLPKMTALSAQALTGDVRSGRHLAALVRENYFTTRQLKCEPVYQYHPLFREYLLKQAPQALGLETHQRLKRRAAAILAEAGDVEAGIGYLIELADWSRLAAQLSRSAPALLAQGRNQTVLDWLERVPSDTFNEKPWLDYWRGMALLPLGPARSQVAFESAYRQFKRADDGEGLYPAWCGAVESILFQGNDYRPLAYWIAELRQLQEHHTLNGSSGIEARVTIDAYGALIFARPSDDLLPAWEQRALRLVQKSPPQPERLAACHYLALKNAWFGGNREVAATARDGVRGALISQDSEIPAVSEILGHLAEFFYAYWFVNPLDACLAPLHAALATAQMRAVHTMDHLILGFLATVELTREQLPDAGARLVAMAKISGPKCRQHAAHFNCLSAWHAWLAGDLPEAHRYAETAVMEARGTHMPAAFLFTSFGLSQVCAAQGQYRGALRRFGETRRLASRSGIHNVEFMCDLAVADIALMRRQPGRCRSFLRRALTAGRRHGYARLSFFRRAQMARLCTDALKAGIEVEYVRRMIVDQQLFSEQPPLGVELWPWSLKVKCFGEFKLFKDAEPVGFSRKAPKKPLQLLKALIAFGGRNVPQSSLVDALWSGEEADAAHRAFTTTLHRLRKIVGSDIIELRESRLSLNPTRCWVDVWAFEHLLDEARRARSEEGGDQWVQLTEEALGLYRDHFLAGDDAPWSVVARERLRQRFLREAGALCRHWQQANHIDKALDCYQTALAVDTLAEELYQGLMHIYQSLGRKTEALETYHRCKRLLSISLGTRPSQATDAIYRAVLSG